MNEVTWIRWQSVSHSPDDVQAQPPNTPCAEAPPERTAQEVGFVLVLCHQQAHVSTHTHTQISSQRAKTSHICEV